MCNIDVNEQMKVFDRNKSYRTKAAARKRLEAAGIITRDGKPTQWYQTLLDRSHE